VGILTDIPATNGRVFTENVSKPDPYLPKGPEKAPSRTKQAFLENFNTLGLAAVVAGAFAFLTPVPVIGAVVLEAIYLLFVPDSKWYKERIGARYDAEVLARREKLKQNVFPQLSDDIQARFGRLETARSQINGQSFEGARWFREVIRKLDYLMEKFLLFATKEVQFKSYLLTVLSEAEALGTGGPPPPPSRYGPSKREPRSDIEAENWAKSTVSVIQDRYQAEADSIDEMLLKDDNLHNQAVLDKRKDILLRRKMYVSQIGDIMTNLTHQLRLIEDTFGLINDEIRARSPEQVLADIEDVVDSTDVLTEALQEVAPFEEMKA
jgi:hypothetical protein